MRRKSNRPFNNNLIMLVLLVITTAIILVAGGLSIIVLADKGIQSFVGYQDQYDVQNECIADLISNGIPRSDIQRTETGCSFTIGVE